MTSLPLARQCLPCNRCCTVMGVEELNKPIDMPCGYVNDAGCRLHGTANKPGSCAEWLCDWRRGQGQDQDRPDLLGVLVVDGVALDAYGLERALWGHVMPDLSPRAQALLEGTESL